jgi:hypothetical protein
MLYCRARMDVKPPSTSNHCPVIDDVAVGLHKYKHMPIKSDGIRFRPSIVRFANYDRRLLSAKAGSTYNPGRSNYMSHSYINVSGNIL